MQWYHICFVFTSLYTFPFKNMNYFLLLRIFTIIIYFYFLNYYIICKISFIIIIENIHILNIHESSNYLYNIIKYTYLYFWNYRILYKISFKNSDYSNSRLILFSGIIFFLIQIITVIRFNIIINNLSN